MGLKAWAAGAAMALAGWSTASAQVADWRALDPENTWVVETSKGTVVVELAPAVAPQTVARIKELTRRGFYDGVIFHRVIGDFMAQTGDPEGTGAGGSDLPNVPGEFTFRRDGSSPFVKLSAEKGMMQGYVGSLPVMTQSDDVMLISAQPWVNAWGAFCPGVVGMARQAEPDTGNSQFFFMRGEERFLDQKYTAFGYVVAGQDVVMKLNVGEPPRSPDKLVRVRMAADMPAAERPKLQVMDVRGAAFRALIEQRRKEEGPTFDICDMTVPSRAG